MAAMQQLQALQRVQAFFKRLYDPQQTQHGNTHAICARFLLPAKLVWKPTPAA